MSRRAHAFHRFAHHPLCERYANELVPLGRRTRLCRGLLLGTGLAVGLVVGLATRAGTLPWAMEGAALVVFLVAAVPARLPKSLTRFLPGLALGAVVAHGPWGWSLAALGLFAASWLFYPASRSEPDSLQRVRRHSRCARAFDGFLPGRERAIPRWARSVLSVP